MVPNSFPIFQLIPNRDVALSFVVLWNGVTDGMWLAFFQSIDTPGACGDDGVGLPEETILRFLGLTLTRSIEWKPYVQYIAKAASRKASSLYSFTPVRPCMEYCSHIWGCTPKFYWLHLLDRVQKLVVSLTGSVISSDLRALSHRRDVAS